jgi:hypothetical protein
MSNYLALWNANLNTFYSQTQTISNKIILVQGSNAYYGVIQFTYLGYPSTYSFISMGVGSSTSVNPVLFITGSNYVGIGTNNPGINGITPYNNVVLDIYGSTRFNGLIYNDLQYIAGPITNYIYPGYIFATYVQFYSGGGQTVTFLNQYVAYPASYLISASVSTAGAGNNTAILSVFPGSPATATITQLQALAPSFTDNTLSTLGIGFTISGSTITISTYNIGWWGFTQTYYFTMQLLSP